MLLLPAIADCDCDCVWHCDCNWVWDWDELKATPRLCRLQCRRWTVDEGQRMEDGGWRTADCRLDMQ